MNLVVENGAVPEETPITPSRIGFFSTCPLGTQADREAMNEAAALALAECEAVDALIPSFRYR